MGAAIVGAVIGSVLTAAFGYFLWHQQVSRKQLGWRILSASVIIPRLSNPIPNIHIAVRPQLLGRTGNDLIPIDEDILGFRIRLRNTGNQIIEDQRVTFTMSEGARVISIEPESQPDLGGRQIQTFVQDPTPNVAATRLPYLNPSQEVIFSIQCLGELKTKCSVSAGAPGLTLQDVEWWNRKLFLGALVSVTLLALLAAAIARILVETGDIAQTSRRDINVSLLFLGVIGGLLIVIGLINLLSVRIDSPEAEEKIKQARSRR